MHACKDQGSNEVDSAEETSTQYRQVDGVQQVKVNEGPELSWSEVRSTFLDVEVDISVQSSLDY